MKRFLSSILFHSRKRILILLLLSITSSSFAESEWVFYRTTPDMQMTILIDKRSIMKLNDYAYLVARRHFAKPITVLDKTDITAFKERMVFNCPNKQWAILRQEILFKNGHISLFVDRNVHEIDNDSWNKITDEDLLDSAFDIACFRTAIGI